MAYRVKWSVVSVSALALLAGGMLASAAPVQAQAPSVLQPRGGWSVTKMDQPSNGAGAYCALARQYDKDIIFTLGRNLTDEYSLAVDFQKEQMDPDKAYKLTLSPGAGQVRAFDLMPLSPRAMVIRLGWDDSFFKALESSRMLRVGIGDVDYSFNMPDIAAGQKDLTACVDGLKQTAKAADGAGDEIVVAAADKTDILNAEPNAVAGFSARKATAAELRASDMSGPPPGMETADAVPAPAVETAPAPSRPTTAADMNGMMSELATLRAENSRLSSALEKQRNKLAESYEQTVDSNALAEMEEKIRLLESENKRLNAGGAAGTVTAAAAKDKAAGGKGVDNAQITDLQRQLNDLKVENNELTQKLAAAQAVKPPSPEAVTEAAGMNAPAGEQVQLQALQKNLALVQEEKIALQTEVETLRRQTEDKQVAAAGGDEKLEKAVRRYNEAEREIQRLGALLEQERKAKDVPGANTERQDQRIALLEKELEKARKEQASIGSETKAELKKTQDTLAKSEAQRMDLQKQNTNLSTEVQQLKTALASLKQNAQADATAQSALDSLQAQLAEKDKQLSALQEQLKVSQASLGEASADARETADLKNRIIQSEKEREALREQNQMFKAELDTLKASSQGQPGLQAALERSEKQNRANNEKIALLESELQRLRAVVALDTARGPQPDTVAQALNNAAPAAGYEPAQPPPADKIAAAIVPAVKPANTSSAPMFGEGDVKALLGRANVGVQGGVRKIAPNIYGWKAGTLSGRAEVLPGEAGFARLVDQHINKAKAQCGGDFAAIPSAQGPGSANFEVACVGARGSTSSSIAFFEQKGSFVAVSVDGAAENMDVAMDTRDRIASAR